MAQDSRTIEHTLARGLRMALLSGLLVGSSSISSQAAIGFCAERDTVVKVLSLRHGESLVGRGMVDTTALFEIWRSSESDTWTLLRTDAKGLSCVMAVGTHWMEHTDASVAGTPG